MDSRDLPNIFEVGIILQIYLSCNEFSNQSVIYLLKVNYRNSRVMFKICSNMLKYISEETISTDNFMFKVFKRNTRTRRKICSRLTIKTPEGQDAWCRSGICIVNFEHILHLILVFLLLTLSM